MSTLTKLKKLFLSNNYITDISSLASLTELVELELDGNVGIIDTSPLIGIKDQLTNYQGCEIIEYPTIISEKDKRILENIENIYVGIFEDAQVMIIIELEGLSVAPKYKSLSWTDSCENGAAVFGGFTEEAYTDLSKGKTYYFSQKTEKGYNFEVWLPDDASIAGSQTITFTCADTQVEIMMNLTYRDEYENHAGWGVEYTGKTLLNGIA